MFTCLQFLNFFGVENDKYIEDFPDVAREQPKAPI